MVQRACRTFPASAVLVLAMLSLLTLGQLGSALPWPDEGDRGFCKVHASCRVRPNKLLRASCFANSPAVCRSGRDPDEIRVAPSGLLPESHALMGLAAEGAIPALPSRALMIHVSSAPGLVGAR